MIDYSALKQRVVDMLTTELGKEDGFDADVLDIKVELAIEDVITRKCYENSSMNDEQISKDLNKYFSTIVNLSRYDYNQRGAEGQSSHNENSVSRSWVDRNSLFKGVSPFIKCF